MGLMSLLEFAHTLHRLQHGWPQACHTALEIAARIVESDAKRAIGTYRYGWPQLAASTQADRVKQGFPANEPLLRTGEMRDSIQHVSSPMEARVGSNNQKAVWQELGTRSIPPRSFLAESLHRNERMIVRAVGQTLRDYLASEKMEADFMRAALHALHQAWEALKDLGEKFVEGPEEPRRRRQ